MKIQDFRSKKTRVKIGNQVPSLSKGLERLPATGFSLTRKIKCVRLYEALKPDLDIVILKARSNSVPPTC